MHSQLKFKWAFIVEYTSQIQNICKKELLCDHLI